MSTSLPTVRVQRKKKISGEALLAAAVAPYDLGLHRPASCKVGKFMVIIVENFIVVYSRTYKFL